MNTDNVDVSYESAQGELLISWPEDKKYHTLVVYDSTIDLIHFLEINIVGNNIGTGTVLLPYLPPNPPVGETHTYNILVYEQVYPIKDKDIDRKGLKEFVRKNNLKKKHYSSFRVTKELTADGSYFEKGSGLTKKEEDFCRCVAHVGAKGSAANKYAVCAASTGTSLGREGCGKYYDWNNLPTDEIVAYLRDYGVDVPDDSTRTEVMKELRKFKENID